MSLSAPLVVPILAIPFGVVPIPEALPHNPELVELFTARRQADSARLQPQPRVYQGTEDLLTWTEEPVRLLAEGMFKGLYAIVDAVNNFTEDQLHSIRLEARSRFTVIERDGHVPMTQHTLTAWCAIYCVAAPLPAPDRQDSGALRIYETRLGTSFADATTAVMRLPFMTGHYGWRPVPGQMAVFPGSLAHEIAMVRSPGQLVLVTMRARFLGPRQEGLSRW